tara:strand:- start:143 stop:661 length:519 start_codon:yes stop_codon:yes gene_type:complete
MAAMAASKLTGTVATARMPAGTVLQVVQDTSSNMVTGSADTRTEVLSATITPSSSSSKILCQYHMSLMGGANETLTYLQRGTTDIYKYTGTDISGTERKATTMGGSMNTGRAWAGITVGAFYLDSPSTTSETTYSVEAFFQGATLYVNRGSGLGSSDEQGGTSTLILMEIGA